MATRHSLFTPHYSPLTTHYLLSVVECDEENDEGGHDDDDQDAGALQHRPAHLGSVRAEMENLEAGNEMDLLAVVATTKGGVIYNPSSTDVIARRDPLWV